MICLVWLRCGQNLKIIVFCAQIMHIMRKLSCVEWLEPNCLYAGYTFWHETDSLNNIGCKKVPFCVRTDVKPCCIISAASGCNGRCSPSRKTHLLFAKTILVFLVSTWQNKWVIRATLFVRWQGFLVFFMTANLDFFEGEKWFQMWLGYFTAWPVCAVQTR